MRVLVAALRLDGGDTSEGLCTTKVVGLLADRGHEVQVLVPGDLAEEADHLLPEGVEVVGVVEPEAPTARVRRLVGRTPGRFRADLGVQVITGFDLDDHARRRTWARAIGHAHRGWRPEVTWARGAGLDLSPVLAAAAVLEGAAWVAHLHDPWPASWWPPAYRVASPGISARQEAAMRRVLDRAPAVTAPSARLLAWTEGRSGVAVGDRGHEVAHVGGPLGVATSGPDPSRYLPDRPLVVAHVGTLLGPRSPHAFLEAVARVHDAEPASAADLGVALLGPFDRRHRDDRGLAVLLDRFQRAGVVRATDRRVAQAEAMAVLEAAGVALVLEAPGPESPFFPAKLADALSLQMPVVAASPARSVVTDLLGADALRADPDDPGAVAGVLTRVWRAWKEGRLADLVPAAGVRARVAPDAVGEAAEVALGAAISEVDPAAR